MLGTGFGWVRNWTDTIVDKRLYPTLFGPAAAASVAVPTGHRMDYVGQHRVPCLKVVPQRAAPMKTAVWLHGNAVSLGDLAKSGLMQALADELQYEMICPDYGGARSAHGRNLDTLQVLHAQDVIAATVQQSAGPVAVFGRSLGAAIAVRAVAESGQDVATRIDHVHLISPFKSLDALLPAWALRFGLLTPHRYDSADAVRHKMMGHTNFSVYHGSDDTLIPASHAQELCDARMHSGWSSARTTVDVINGMTHDPLPFARHLVNTIKARCDHK